MSDRDEELVRGAINATECHRQYEALGAFNRIVSEVERLRQRVEFLMGIVDVRENETARLLGLLTSIRSRLNPDYAPWAKWIARIDAALGKEEPR